MKITAEDIRNHRNYRKLEVPNSLGNLHERMFAVRELASAINLHEVNPRLWNAICDLELEVSYHEPADPPYGHRTLPELRGVVL